MGWGTVLSDYMRARTWTVRDSHLYVNLGLFQALAMSKAFEQCLQGRSHPVLTNKTIVLCYLNNMGGNQSSTIG